MVFTIITAATLALASGLVITTFDGTKSTTQSWYAENDPVRTINSLFSACRSPPFVLHTVYLTRCALKGVPPACARMCVCDLCWAFVAHHSPHRFFLPIFRSFSPSSFSSFQVMGGVSNSTFTVTHNVGVWQGEVKVVPKLRVLYASCAFSTQPSFSSFLFFLSRSPRRLPFFFSRSLFSSLTACPVPPFPRMLGFLQAPGFCTARTQHDFPDLSAFDGLIVTASADASANSLTNFKMTLESSAGSSQRGGEFEGKFQTHGASSTQYFIPFASMTQSYRGQPEGGPPTKKQLAAVTGLGFISDGVAGPFGQCKHVADAHSATKYTWAAPV